jgi:hypothetical protein
VNPADTGASPPAVASIVTGPAVTPVTCFVATPAAASLAPRPLTVPEPAAWPNETVAAVDVARLSFASRNSTVRSAAVPDVRSDMAAKTR